MPKIFVPIGEDWVKNIVENKYLIPGTWILAYDGILEYHGQNGQTFRGDIEAIEAMIHACDPIED